jgi:propionyl-CoA carboxylase alpha chain
MAHHNFASGDINTNFIAEQYPDGFFGAELTSETTKTFLCVAINIYLEDVKRAVTISGQMPGRQRHVGNRWVVSIDGEQYSIYVKALDNGYELKHESNSMEIKSAWVLGKGLFHGTVDGRTVNVQIEHFAGGYYLTHAGSRVRATVRSPRVAELDKFMPEPKDVKDSSKVEAPISGVIVDVKVKAGEEVKKGQELFILEAMKMENIICAEKDAVVDKVHLKKGDNTTYGEVVLEFATA